MMRKFILNKLQPVIILLTAICGATPVAIAQQSVKNGLTIKTCPGGLYLELHDLLPVGVGYEVYRKEAEKGDFRQIGGFLPPGSQTGLNVRLNEYGVLLGNYAPFRQQLVSTFWSMYQGDTRDSLILGEELPPLYLAIGKSFADTTAQIGHTYTYRLQFTNGSQIESGEVTVSSYTAQFAPIVNYVADAGYSRIALEWKTSMQGAPPYWEVWRRQNGSSGKFILVMPEKGVRRISNTDSLSFLVVDSTVFTGITYDYYLQAKDALGNGGTHSDTVRIEVGGRKNVPAIHSFNTVSDSAGIKLTWHLPGAIASLRSILVLRSDQYDNGYETIAMIPPTDSIYVDRNVVGGTNYYYQLIAEGDANFSIPTARVSGMFYLEDPAVLEPVFGMKTAGLDKSVALSWYYENRNIAGFHIFRSMAYDGAYMQIGDLLQVTAATDTSAYMFVDSVGLKANVSYYYRAVPVSRTYKRGPLSEPVAAVPRGIRTVTIPSAIRTIYIADTLVSFSWKDLQSAEPGIAGYRVYRKDTSSNEFSDKDLIAEAGANEFTDTLKAGQQAWYALRTTAVNGDMSGFSEPVHISARVDKPLPPGSFRAYAQDTEILLTWDGNTNGRIINYHIYRAMGKDAVQKLATVPAGTEELAYTDKTVKKGIRYYYYITAEHVSGIESNKTSEVIVSLN